MTKGKKRTWMIAISILSALLLLLLAFGLSLFSTLRDTLEQVTTPKEESAVYAVYVRSEDPAAHLSQTAGYPYGVHPTAAGPADLEQALQHLEEALGARPQITSYDSPFSLMDALLQQKSRAVLLNEALFESIAETEGYEWVRDGVRKLESYAVEEPGEEGEPVDTPQEVPESFVVYISGIDTYGGISARSRSDVNILAVVNTKTRQVLTLATPRDFYVDFAATGGAKDKLTHAGIYGVAASIDALERLYGVRVDYYLRINFSGFVQVIDALGGVDVYSDYAFTVQGIREYQAGYNHLTGLEALAFARERYSFSNGDYQRAKNQMEVIKAVIQKCASPALLLNYRSVMEGIAGSFETNMPQGQIASLVRMQLFDNRPWDVSSFTTQGTSAYEVTYSMPGRRLYVIHPDPQSMQEAKDRIAQVQNAG